MPWYKVHVEAVVRGHAYVEAPDEVTANYIATNAPLAAAIHHQTLREAISEKVSFTPLDIELQIEGIDYVDPEK